MKKCPFNNKDCTEECALYISSNELNESVVNRLKSIGVLSQDEGSCALKNMALASIRNIFENTNVKRF